MESADMKSVGIIGAGRIGQVMACGQRVLFLSGADADAKSEVGGLLADAGFFVVDLGGLRDGGQMRQFGGPLAGHDLISLP
jgi:8-hydroxy-5-deazaflavin:NADPH oxidoreductase